MIAADLWAIFVKADDWSEMLLTTSMLVEAAPGLQVEMVAEERRRGISHVSPLDGGALDDSTLYVSDASMLEGAQSTPRNLVMVGRPAPEHTHGVANLCIVGGDASVDMVCGILSGALARLVQWDARILEAIALHQSVDTILAIAAEGLANPVALFDSTLGLVSYAGGFDNGIEGTIWENVLANHFSPPEFYTSEERATFSHLSSTAWPVVVRPARDVPHEHLIRNIALGGRLVGALALVDVNGPFSAGQVALVDAVADRLQTALHVAMSLDGQGGDFSIILRGILNGGRVDPALVAHHLATLGWAEPLSLRMHLCVFAAESLNPLARRNVVERMGRACPGSVVMEYEGALIVLSRSPRDGLSEKASKIVSSLQMRVASSERFFHVSDARHAFDQCRFVASLPEGRVEGEASVSRLFERALPLAIGRGVNAELLCDRTVLDLAIRGYKGDVERGRALVRELYAYLMAGRKASVAARGLYLHRNTLVYHLELLEGVLGLRFDELDTSGVLFLTVSCLVALERAMR